MTERLNRWAGWTIAVVVITDWVTKFLVQNRMAIYDQIAVLDGWIYLVHLQNTGVAFSMLDNAAGAWRTPLLSLVIAIAILALVLFARTVTDVRTRMGFALVIGGALGNLGDRIIGGGVTDFVQVRFFPYVFNVADIAVTMGGILVAIGMIVIPNNPHAQEQ